MRPPAHFISSAILATGLYFYLNSLRAALFFFLGGVIIDLDHLFEYFREPEEKFSLKGAYDKFVNIRFKKIYLFLHSWEFLAGFWALIAFLKLGFLWIAFVLGFSLHLILDQLYNPTCTYFYFFLFRLMKGFKKEGLIRESS